MFSFTHGEFKVDIKSKIELLIGINVCVGHCCSGLAALFNSMSYELEGGTKHHHKVLRDNIQGIAKLAIWHLALRGGVKCISGLIYKHMRASSIFFQSTSFVMPSPTPCMLTGKRSLQWTSSTH
ncbi:Histone H4 [Forsythia ovata]|uniref:Histone H4 n=1 Tax=Forsythia ovata TaxID=205694 RepID=A0ABD1T9J4_9LAMI